MIEKLFLAGADCFRLNYSHGSQEQKKELLMTIREIEEKYSHPIGILGDLQGPKLRVRTTKHKKKDSPFRYFRFVSYLLVLVVAQVGEFSSETGEILEAGQKFRLDLDTALGDKTRVNLPHPEIIEASEVGHTLMVDDGKVKLTVIEKGGNYLNCRVDVPGKISNRKGVNTPDSILEISPLTKKDRSDLDSMVRHPIFFRVILFQT
jgi:pyruvate kinase